MKYMYHVKYWTVKALCATVLLFLLYGTGIGDTVHAV